MEANFHFVRNSGAWHFRWDFAISLSARSDSGSCFIKKSAMRASANQELPRKISQISKAFQQDDRGGSQPGERGDPPGVGELAHPGFISRELHQRNKRERQLKAQNDLAEDEQAHGFQGECFQHA